MSCLDHYVFVRLKPLGIPGLVLVVLIAGFHLSVSAQQVSASLASAANLPDAPGAGSPAVLPDVTPVEPKSPSTIFGTVLDSNGAAVSGASVSLMGSLDRVLVSGNNGEFSFVGLPAGIFNLEITAAGMGKVTILRVVLASDEVRFLPKIVLPLATVDTDVRVVADSEQVAEEQVHEEMQQRVLGIVPNFFSSYDWNASPLWAKQKFELALRSVTDPVTIVGAGGVAGIEQAINRFPGYGQGAQGYGKRFGAAYANDVVSRMLDSAILPSLFRQDPRYFYKGSGSVKSRALYALGAAFVCRGDNGRTQPNFSHILGTFAAGGISNLYYPSANRGVSLTLLNGLIGTVGNAGTNLIREFVLRGLTPRVPASETGKP